MPDWYACAGWAMFGGTWLVMAYRILCDCEPFFMALAFIALFTIPLMIIVPGWPVVLALATVYWLAHR